MAFDLQAFLGVLVIDHALFTFLCSVGFRRRCFTARSKQGSRGAKHHAGSDEGGGEDYDLRHVFIPLLSRDQRGLGARCIGRCDRITGRPSTLFAMI